jgi:hypothetical protein
MIVNGFSPFGPIFLILPFNNPFYGEISGILGPVKTNHPKTPAPDIRDKLPLVQGFMLPDFGDHTVKMDWLAGIFIRLSGGYIFNRLSAIGTIRRWDRFGRHFWGYPFETIIHNSPICVISGGIRFFFAFPGPVFVVPLPVSKRFPSVISAPSTAAHTIVLLQNHLIIHHSRFGQSVVSPRQDNPYYLFFFEDYQFLRMFSDTLGDG